MARQDNKLPFVGRIGELIYYKRNGKYFVRRAGYPSKEKLILHRSLKRPES